MREEPWTARLPRQLVKFQGRVEIGWKPTPSPSSSSTFTVKRARHVGWLRESLIEIYQRAPNLIRRVCSWRGGGEEGECFRVA